VIPYKGINGCTLANGVKYFFNVGDGDSTYKSIHLKWDASIVVTLTLWGCDQPLNVSNMDPGGGVIVGTDTPVDSLVTGDWLKIDPATAVLYFTSDDGTTGGNTITNATCVIAGGAAGGVIYDLGNVPVARLRIRAVVGGTGGQLRCVASGKE
jgi:hypothetical protein